MYSVEWRTNNAYDSLVVCWTGTLDGQPEAQETRVITVFLPAGKEEIQDFLVSPGSFADWNGNEIPDDDTSPEDYGELVLSRTEDNGVSCPDGERFAERLAFWFRTN